MTTPRRPAREVCYTAIRGCMKDGIGDYYREFPDRMFDDRSKLAIKHSIVGLEAIFAVLDGYAIEYLDTPPEEAAPASD